MGVAFGKNCFRSKWIRKRCCHRNEDELLFKWHSNRQHRWVVRRYKYEQFILCALFISSLAWVDPAVSNKMNGLERKRKRASGRNGWRGNCWKLCGRLGGDESLQCTLRSASALDSHLFLKCVRRKYIIEIPLSIRLSSLLLSYVAVLAHPARTACGKIGFDDCIGRFCWIEKRNATSVYMNSFNFFV